MAITSPRIVETAIVWLPLDDGQTQDLRGFRWESLVSNKHLRRIEIANAWGPVLNLLLFDRRRDSEQAGKLQE